jgi:hypothetical protein
LPSSISIKVYFKPSYETLKNRIAHSLLPWKFDRFGKFFFSRMVNKERSSYCRETDCGEQFKDFKLG